MSIPRYERYKDSGVEWLGEVPEQWDVKRLRFAACVNPSKKELGPIAPETQVSFFPMDAIQISGPPNTDSERTIADVETGYTYFRDGDVAFAKITPCFENGKRALFNRLTNGIGFGTTELIILRARTQQSVASFLYWLCASSHFMSPAEGSMYGTGGQKRVSEEFVKDFSVAWPPIEEQEQIARFLDRETAKIDALIEEQRRLIVLLKEKRQAVISHAVTKGLNPDAPMKSSGVEWLGEVPVHWDVLRLGSLFKEINEEGNDDLPILSVSIHDGVSDRQLGDEEVERKVTRSEDTSKYKKVAPADLVYNMMRAWQGGFGCVTIPGLVSPAYVVARPIRAFSSELVEQILRTSCAVEEMRRYSKGVTDFRLRLYWDEFKSIHVALPPQNEQEQIIAHIQSQTDEFDELTVVATRAIDLLQERRSALISAAVTGKINVTTQVAKPVRSTWSPGFARHVLAAETLSRCNSPRMGRVKLQKLIHLCEYHAQLDELGSIYSRQAAGPFAPQVMEDVREGLLQQRWFEEYKDESRYAYRALEKAGGHKQYLPHWEDKQAKIDQVLNLLKDARTEKCEIASTLYAAWNDLLLEGKNPTDAEIIHEASSAERWHENKEKIATGKWPEALKWMRANGLVPVGYGTHTTHQPDLFPREGHEPA